MLQQHIILALAWIIFCVLHSVLANNKIKQEMELSFPAFFKYYRLSYTIFAFASLIWVLIYQISITSPMLYKPVRWLTIAGFGITITGAAIMLICIKKYFLSLSGLKSFLANKIVANELRIDGIHKYVRHPLYLGTFIFIWGGFLLFPYLSLLIAICIITIYTLIGIRLEEEKLLGEFGEAYQNYRQQTPMIFPLIRR
jgi:protein-S-isoprenylcysteine O-methyltransferase Ste14